MTPAAPTPADVAVVVPVHRGGERFAACLASLQALDPLPGRLVVAVDGGEGHDDPDAVAARAAGAHVVHTTRRSGPAAARNLGAGATDAPVLWFVDADVTVAPDGVARACAALAARPDHVAVIGSYDDDPPERNVLSRYKNLLHHHVHQRANPEASTFWGACGAVRHEAFDAVGGFDPAYAEPSIEDIELGWRLRAAGGRIALDRGWQVTHLKRWEPWGLLHTEVARRAVPWSLLILRTGEMPDDLNVDVTARLKVAAAGIGLAALPAAPRSRAARRVALGVAAGLAAADRDLITMFTRRGGSRFAVQATAWHWWSYVYSGAAFAWAAAVHLRQGRRATRR